MYGQVLRRIESCAEEIDRALEAKAVHEAEERLKEYTKVLKESEGLFASAADPQEKTERRRKHRDLQAKLEAYSRRIEEMRAPRINPLPISPHLASSHGEENLEERFRAGQPPCDVYGDDYYARNTRKINDYISISAHSLNSLVKQKRLFRDTRQKLEEGLQHLGLSDRTVDRISNRYLNDYRLFLGLLTLLVLLFLYVLFK